MLKRIPKSDISIRPFKAYKEWTFDETSTQVSVLEAVDGDYTSIAANSVTSGMLSGSSFNKYSLYGQLRAQFYNGKEDDVFYRVGSKTNVYDNTTSTKERFLSGSAKVISIPQLYTGDGIKKSSFSLVETGYTFTDDGYGNIKNSLTNQIIGNVFYSQGLIVITREPSARLTSSWDIYYKSTETIYEHEYLLIVDEDEFNVSTNPSSVIVVNRESSSFVDSDGIIQNVVTNPGVQYIRKRRSYSTKIKENVDE
jgi:hypothetical protein